MAASWPAAIFPSTSPRWQQHGIPTIDMVVVNLYPFQQTVAKDECALEDAIENIDIGGPTMLRSSAKNHKDVIVICDPLDYSAVLDELKAGNGEVSYDTKFALAKKVFAHTAQYDGAITNYLTSLGADKAHATRSPYPQTLNIAAEKVQEMRYGENPHQSAAFYRDLNPCDGALANYTQLQGKELSYNNIGDADAAWECVKTFDGAACVIVKHANPCGVAVGANALDSYSKALQTDPTSAFGGIIAFNCVVRWRGSRGGRQTIRRTGDRAIVYRRSEADFCRQTERAPAGNPARQGHNPFDIKRVGGGLLVQSPDTRNVGPADIRVVTTLQPTPQQMQDMMFAWRVAKFVKSNAIVFCGNGMTLGVGAGQMSRVDSARIASIKAQNAGLSLTGSAVASDAFFPFRDGLDVVIDAGATCVIQPGGSMRDQEVIDAANERGVVMLYTGIRHFRH